MSRAICRTTRRIGHPAWAITLLLALAGCGPKAELVLRQPFAPPSQQNLKLVSQRGYHTGSGDQQACLLTFPLPGAVDGPRAFIIYLAAPSRPGKLAVAPDDPEGVRGFLIQEVGALAGRSDLVAGTVSFREVLLSPHLRRLDIDVRTEDGAEIAGRAVLEELPREVQAFEREFAADIARLSPAQSQPASEEPTRPRGTSGP
jgi:hypothetical protein